MKSVTVNADTAKAAGLTYSENNGIATFAFAPATLHAKPVIVTVRIVSGAWQFFPERSSGQSRVLGALGIT